MELGDCIKEIQELPRKKQVRKNILDLNQGLIQLQNIERNIFKKPQIYFKDYDNYQKTNYNQGFSKGIEPTEMFETDDLLQFQQADKQIIQNQLNQELKKQIQAQYKDELLKKEEKVDQMIEFIKKKFHFQKEVKYNQLSKNNYTLKFGFDPFDINKAVLGENTIAPQYKNYQFWQEGFYGQVHKIKNTPVFEKNIVLGSLDQIEQNIKSGMQEFEQSYQSEPDCNDVQQQIKIARVLSMNPNFLNKNGEKIQVKDQREIEKKQMVKKKQQISFQQLLAQIDSPDFISKEEEVNFESTEDLVEEKNINSRFKIIKLTQTNELVSKRNKYTFAVVDEMDLTNFYQILPRTKFALSFPFELDDFQKKAILRLEHDENVFVCAHTSAGKTVVAEYAIALSQKHRRKVIYTSPIKALSNEKYRKLLRQFKDVGIITGDVTLNPQASCLVMTTEILRKLLYKGSDMIRDVLWVIFDEVHYINNPERGVVWEETIIMLPEYIGIIMLSATVPNYMDFANWVGRTKNKIVYVQRTMWRPVPLEHSAYIAGHFHLIKDMENNFLASEYEQLHKIVKIQEMQHQQLKDSKKIELQTEKGDLYKEKKSQGLKFQMKNANEKFIKGKFQTTDLDKNRDEKRALQELLQHCNKKNLLPAVVFIFSKNKIMEMARNLMGREYVTKHEQNEIIKYYNRAMRFIKKRDQDLKQLQLLFQLLTRGIGVHHGDLLPIAKEIVEILFSEGLIKVLLATETFAMGINMPTKTVIFHALKKNDGSNLRPLNSSEYTQMAGRAGRRGLDDKGNVILYFKEISMLPSTVDMGKMVDAKGEILESKFKISYVIILNLLTSKEINIMEMMQRSFSENYKFASLPKNKEKMLEYRKKFEELTEVNCDNQPIQVQGCQTFIESYFKCSNRLRKQNIEYFLKQSSDFDKVQLPRFCIILGTNCSVDLGIILNMSSKEQKLTVLFVSQIDYMDEEQSEKEKKIKDMNKLSLEYDDKDWNKNVKNQQIKNFNGWYFKQYTVKAQDLLEIYSEKIKIDMNNLQWEAAKLLIEKKKTVDIRNLLVNNGTKKKDDFQRVVMKGNNQESRQMKDLLIQDLINNKVHGCYLRSEHLEQYQKRKVTKRKMKKLAEDLDENNLIFNQTLEGKLKVLTYFNFIDQNQQPQIKARIAREVEDIYICELLLENILYPLSSAEIAGLLSIFVCQHKDRKKTKQEFIEDPIFSDEMYYAIQKTHNKVGEICQIESKFGSIVEDPDRYLDELLNFSMTRTILEWASGIDFIDVCKHTSANEGIVVRTIQRLEMLMRSVKSALKIMGNKKICNKLEEAQNMIKRDIVFSQSLYLEE